MHFFLYILQKLNINNNLKYLKKQKTIKIKLLFPQKKLNTNPLPIKIKIQKL